MLLNELFLRETTEEDREIISLSVSIYEHLKQYIDHEDDYDYAGDDVDDSLLDTEDEDVIRLGTIGQLFDTEIKPLRKIYLNLQSNYGMQTRLRILKDPDAIRTPGNSAIMGMWDPETKTIFLNKDYLGSSKMRRVITHELRHALDDLKSKFKANQSNRYFTPKNKEYRNITNDPVMGNVSYLAQPGEINARFAEVLHKMVKNVRVAFNRLDADKIKPTIMSNFYHEMQSSRISELFTERTQSKDFKRLLSRGMSFIENEIAKEEERTGKKATGTFS